MSAVVDFPVKPETRPYLDAFVENRGEPEWLRRSRRLALARFAELGFPSRRSENWRYFDLQSLQRRSPLPAVPGSLAAVPAELGFDGDWPRFVLADGNIVHRPAHYHLPAGVNLKSIRGAIERWPLLDQAAITSCDGALSALNAALFTDGFLLDVAAGAIVQKPTEFIHFGSAGASQTRSLVNLGEGARATIIETYAGESARYWRNDVVSVRLAEGAELTRIVLVEEGAEAIHTALTDVQLGAGARFTEFVLLLGGHRVRHEVNVRLVGEGARCEIDGAYIVGSGNEANIVTAIEHAAPGGQTRELIKGVAAGSGHGAFQGRIVVHEHAQKTDAHQLSRNLLLGRRAVIDTKPELEIYADDVKCSHGASVGDLDGTALFYLSTRGIPDREARHMLIEGFLREAVDSVGDAAIREHLQRRLTARLAVLEEAE